MSESPVKEHVATQEEYDHARVPPTLSFQSQVFASEPRGGWWVSDVISVLMDGKRENPPYSACYGEYTSPFETTARGCDS